MEKNKMRSLLKQLRDLNRDLTALRFQQNKISFWESLKLKFDKMKVK